MPSLTSKMPATVEQVLQAESARTGWISVVSVQDGESGSVVSSISRYERRYFYTLIDTGRLQINRDQVVVGLDKKHILAA